MNQIDLNTRVAVITGGAQILDQRRHRPGIGAEFG